MATYPALPHGTAAILVGRDGSRCHYCGVKVAFEHLSPPYRGGKLSSANPRVLTYALPNGKTGWRWRATIDHVRDRAQGGTDDLDNLVVACTCCNHAKAAYTSNGGPTCAFDPDAHDCIHHVRTGDDCILLRPVRPDRSRWLVYPVVLLAVDLTAADVRCKRGLPVGAA